jgi:hypothetical protein
MLQLSLGFQAFYMAVAMLTAFHSKNEHVQCTGNALA